MMIYSKNSSVLESMKIMLIGLFIISINGCGGGSQIAVGSISESNFAQITINDDAITWGFSATVQSGKFANGDTWVVGPVTLIDITPRYNGNNNGFEVNPVNTILQGFDIRINSFSPSLVPSLPYKAVPGQSIVKVVSVDASNISCRPCIQSAAVLTVLSEPPPNDGANIFRPPYFGTDKPLYSTDNINYSLLPNYSEINSAITFSQVASQYSTVQLDHKIGWLGRPLHPIESMPDYGSAIAKKNTEAALAIMLQGTKIEKSQAVINYVNNGIDIYHMAVEGVTWPAAGGHGEGRKLPAIMAAVLLENNAMKNMLTNIESATFGETSGVVYSATADNGNGKVLFGQETRTELEYWRTAVFDTGSRTAIDPYNQIDGGPISYGSRYQVCCLSIVWENIVTALELMPLLKPVFNFPNLKIYTDRWMASGFHTQPDTCAPATGTANFDSDYGVVFGPDGSGGCIQDLDSSDGIGRFPQLHSTSAGLGSYGSAFATEMKAKYLP